MIKLAYVKEKSGFDCNDEYLKHMTHISYSFAKVKDKKGNVYEEFKNTDKLKLFQEKNPHVKILLAIGGWGAGNFSESAINVENRERFVFSALEIVQKYNMDGVDLDWEYPTLSDSGITSNPNDKENFTSLMKLFRLKLDDLSIKTNKKYSITFACGATPTMIQSYDFKELNKICDFMNLMTYDMGGCFTTTGFQTNLYPSSITKQPGGAYYVDLFSKAGFDKSKIVYGCAFYGRGGSGLSNYFDNNGLNEYIYDKKGLYFDYHDILDIIKENALTEHYDPECVGVHIYYNDTFISYDNPQTIKEKLKYVDENNLAGIMFWEHVTDKSRSLISEIINYKKV